MAGGGHIEVAQAYVTIIPSMQGAQGKIADELGAEARKAGDGAGKTLGDALRDGASTGAGGIGGTLRDSVSSALSGVGDIAATAFAGVVRAAEVAAAAATAALAGIGKAALDGYAEFEQLEGGVKKLFGEDAAQTIQQNAQNAFRTAGMSANDYMQQATTFSASLIKGLNGDTAEAARLTDVAIRAMSDNVNTFGTDAGDVQNAFNGFAKQNYTMLDNLKLGYAGTKDGMAQLVKDSGVLGDAAADLTAKNLDEKVSFGQIVEAIQAVQVQQGIAGTTANEAATTIEGSVATAKAAWSNWVTELGKDNADMEGRTTELAESLATAAGNVVPRVIEIGQSMLATIPDMVAQALGGIRDAILPQLDEITGGAASEALGRLEELGSHASETFGTLSGSLDGLAPAFAGVATSLGSGVISALDGFLSILDAITPLARDIAANIAPMFSDAMDRLSGVVSTVQGAVAGFFERLQPMAPVISDVAGALGDILLTSMEAVADVIKWLSPILAKIVEVVLPPLSDILKAQGSLWKTLLDALRPVGDYIGPTLTDVVLPLVGEALKVLADNVKLVTDMLKPLFEGLGKIIGVASDAWNGVLGLFTGGRQDVGSEMDGLKAEVPEKMGEAAEATKTAAQDGLADLPSLFDAAGTDATGQLGTSLGTGGTDALDRLAQSLRDGSPNVSDAAKSATDDAAAQTASLPGLFAEHGTTATDQLASALTNGTAGVGSAADLVRAAQDGARNGEGHAFGDAFVSEISEGALGRIPDVDAAAAAAVEAQRRSDVSDESYAWGDQMMGRVHDGMRAQLGGVGDMAADAAARQRWADIHDEAYDWGYHLGRNLADGLASMLGNIAAVAADIARAISDFLGHSTPRLGPLRDDDLWTVHLGQNLTDGLRRSAPAVRDAARGLANEMDAALGTEKNYSARYDVGGAMRPLAMARPPVYDVGGAAGTGTVVNVALNYDAGADANQMAYDVADRLALALGARGM